MVNGEKWDSAEFGREAEDGGEDGDGWRVGAMVEGGAALG